MAGTTRLGSSNLDLAIDVWGASFVIYAFGVPYLWLMMHATGVDLGWSELMWAGMLPFIPGDALKCALAAVLSPQARVAVSRVEP